MRDEINYAALIDSAMHSIVKEALRIAAVEGLPGEHHFYISFVTRFAGVKLSERLRQKYPEEMTIVLQYQFESLEVYQDRFAVSLRFDGIPESIVVPFLAMTAFADPSVKFGLQFRHLDDLLRLPQDNDEAQDKVQGIHFPAMEAKTGDIFVPRVAQAAADQAVEVKEEIDNVIVLDRFRKKRDK